MLCPFTLLPFAREASSFGLQMADAAKPEAIGKSKWLSEVSKLLMRQEKPRKRLENTEARTSVRAENPPALTLGFLFLR